MAIGALVACFAVIGCGGGGSSSSPSGGDGGSSGSANTNANGGGNSGGVCKTYVACDLLDVSGVNQALGTSIAKGVETDAAGIFGCEYGLAERSLVNLAFSIACNPGTPNGPDAYDIVEQQIYGGVNTPVTGLGAIRFLAHNVSGGGAGGRRHDGRVLRRVQPGRASRQGGGTGTIDPKAVATQVAMMLLSKV